MAMCTTFIMLGFVIVSLLAYLRAVEALNASPNDGRQTSIVSGGTQYIHQETSDRQLLLHQCFRQSSSDALLMSGIVDAARNHNGPDPYRALEIGCGAGHTTLDLLNEVLPSNAKIVAVDADASMIAAAEEKLQNNQKSEETTQRISFLHQSGESFANDANERFDAVWLRFVVVDVPTPQELLKAATACLKPGGILLTEDTCTVGISSVCDPLMYAHEFSMHVMLRPLGSWAEI